MLYLPISVTSKVFYLLGITMRWEIYVQKEEKAEEEVKRGKENY